MTDRPTEPNHQPNSEVNVRSETRTQTVAEQQVEQLLAELRAACATHRDNYGLTAADSAKLKTTYERRVANLNGAQP